MSLDETKKIYRPKINCPLSSTFRKEIVINKHDDLVSSDSEGTKELHLAFDENPQSFIKINSKYYETLPTIDRARVFILENKNDPELTQ